jgi:hypothetical protein
MSAMSDMSEHRLPSFEETVVIEALFLEKQELFLERKRLIEAVSELANLRQKMKEMEVKMRQEMEMEAKMRQEVELEKEVLKKELEKSLATMCMLRRKEKEVLKEALKKELEEDEKDYEKIEVNIKGGGNRGNIERYNNFNISFNISLPEITLHQKEMELCLILQNSNIELCDQYYYPKLGSSHTNTTGYSSTMIVSGRCGKSYGFTSNQYGMHKSHYSNIWIQLVRNSDIGILLSQQGNNPSKWEKIIKTLAQKISDEMDKIFNLSPGFRYMEKIF